MKVLFVESDQPVEYNCSNWRCMVPNRALLKAGVHSAVVRIEDWSAGEPECEELTEAADIVFIQRDVFNEVLHRIVQWKQRGKILVVDLDDAYEHMTENTGCPSYELWANGRIKQDDKWMQLHPKPIDQLKWGVHLTGAVSSPSKVICEDWKEYAKTYLFPNYIDGSIYRRVENYHPDNTVLIGWGGSMTHLYSWQGSGLAEACRRIMKEYPKVNLYLIGDPRVQKFVDAAPSRKMAVGWVSGAEFGQRLCVADIGVIPLCGEYDRRRSWIKTLEYTILGIPWIGSNMEPNRDIKTGMLIDNTVDAWHRALTIYLSDLDRFKEQAKENMAIGEALTVDNNVDNLLKLFSKIIEENS